MPTSITAFVGRTLRGPTDRPWLVHSLAEFTRLYGGLWTHSTVSYAVQQYFVNGGRDALICRVQNHGVAAACTLPAGFYLVAANEGAWGNRLRVRVAHAPAADGEGVESRFNLSVEDTATGTVEEFLNLSTHPSHPRFVRKVLAESSEFVRVDGEVPATRPIPVGHAPAGDDVLDDPTAWTQFNADGSDGNELTADDISHPDLAARHAGLWLLDHADLFNILCIPPLTRADDLDKATWDAAIAYAKGRRAMVIIDPPANWVTPSEVVEGLPGLATPDENAALYFPRVRVVDDLDKDRLEVLPPCGIVAGIYSRTDAERGVWKAPAGPDAQLLEVAGLACDLTNGQIVQLDRLGVNGLRSFGLNPPVVWGARTLLSADKLPSEWRYVPVRRLALFLEESLVRGTQWAAFEPNDERLWRKLRLSVGEFMEMLFRQSAFQGTSPREAYFVRCDTETNPQDAIDRGIVNVEVGFAPLKPGEFVVISIQQIAGQVAS